MPEYLILGQRLNTSDSCFASALAEAHHEKHRPLCLCADTSPEMYVARLENGFIVKRMPGTGWLHSAECSSFEPAENLTGLGQLIGSAVAEDPATGMTALRLGFPMSKGRSRPVPPASGGSTGSVSSDGDRLTLRSLLHYLWDQAELTRWHPGFAGRRTWATVRVHLALAAEGKVVNGQALSNRLYVPEAFNLDRRDQIARRRTATWQRGTQASGEARPLMLLIGEVKEITPSRYGACAMIRHVPDQGFVLDEQLYRRTRARFEPELSMWATSTSIRMILIGTFGLNVVGVPALAALSLMPVTAQWIPVEDAAEQILVERLVHEERRFVKGLRYKLDARDLIANATLTDAGPAPVALLIDRGNVDDARPRLDPHAFATENGMGAWVWRVADEQQLELPSKTKSGPP